MSSETVIPAAGPVASEDEAGILLEVCLSSNYHTGAVGKGKPHPLTTFLEAGVAHTFIRPEAVLSPAS